MYIGVTTYIRSEIISLICSPSGWIPRVNLPLVIAEERRCEREQRGGRQDNPSMPPIKDQDRRTTAQLLSVVYSSLRSGQWGAVADSARVELERRGVDIASSLATRTRTGGAK